MPEAKGEVDPLLGRSFFKNLTIEFNQDTGRLKIKKLETAVEDAGADSKAVAEADSKDSPKASAKTKRAVRQPRTTAKSKRATRKSRSAATEDGQMPEGGADQPN
jgi:hypothetical protein